MIGVETVLYGLIGVVSGTLAGLLGVGGGLVIVPALLFTLEWQGIHASMHLAVGTSLAVIFFTALSSSYAHHRKGGVIWSVVLKITPGILLGSCLGAGVAYMIPGDFLRKGFGLFACVTALYMLVEGGHTALSPGERAPSTFWMVLAGGVIGGISALVGIGGGLLSVPWLTYCQLDIKHAISTSAAIGMPIALFGAIGFMVAGWRVEHLPAGSLGYVYLPAWLPIALTSILLAPWGAKLAHTLSPDRLRMIFSCLLVIVSLKVIFG